MGTKIFIPKMGANIEKVQIGKIYVKVKDTVKKGDLLFQIVTDKATFDVEADDDGKILSLDCKEDEELNVLEEIGYIGKEGETIPPLKKENKKLKATPSAKKIAKENNINLNSIFKKDDKIIKEQDVLEYLEKNNENIKIEELSFRKKAEIKNLLKNKDLIPSSVTVSISTKKIKEKLEKYPNIKLGEYISHTISKILKKFPKLNAYYNSDKIYIYKDINIGMVVGFEEDLFVPVIHNTNNLSLEEFSSKFKELVFKVIKGDIKIEDLSKGTFTISDLSQYGIIEFDPLINSNQSAILGISSEHDDKLNLTLVFDHRVTNGKYAAEFLNELKKLL